MLPANFSTRKNIFASNPEKSLLEANLSFLDTFNPLPDNLDF